MFKTFAIALRLSLVTVVFPDDTDIYRARQLVSERMREVEQSVAAHYGKPQMGPISTGLGEVFQFVVRSPSLMEAVETLDGPVLVLAGAEQVDNSRVGVEELAAAGRAAGRAVLVEELLLRRVRACVLEDGQEQVAAPGFVGG